MINNQNCKLVYYTPCATCTKTSCKNCEITDKIEVIEQERIYINKE